MKNKLALLHEIKNGHFVHIYSVPVCSQRLVCLPEHVEDLSVGVDPDEDVGHGDELELGVLGVGEVDLGLPDGLDEVGVVEVERLLDVVVVEPLVHPRLPQVQVHLVVLRREKRKAVID